jgi:predicted nucleic acid-binding protein
MKVVIDTRFLVTHFLAPDDKTKKWTKTILESLQKEANLGIIPSIVIHEFYKFEMQNLGIDVANIRANILLKSKLTPIDLDPTIAIEAAKLRCKYLDLPTADAIIAATVIKLSSDFVLTDDKHIKQIKEIKTQWISTSS